MRAFKPAFSTLLVVALMAAAAPSFAQQKGPSLPIAYISLQRILTEADDAKAANKELEALRAVKAKELAAKKEALDKTKLDLANAGGFFSASKREQLKATEKQQETELTQATQQASADFQERQRKLQIELRTELNAVLNVLANQRGIQWVLNQDTALLAGPSGADLTAEVLTRLNAASAQRAAAAATKK